MLRNLFECIHNIVWSVQKTSQDYSNPVLHPADTAHTFLWHRSFFPRRRYTSCGVQVGAEMSNCRQSWREEQLCTGLYIRLHGDVVPLCHQHGRYRCQRNFAVIFKIFRKDSARFSVARQYCSIDAQFFNTTQLFKFLMNFLHLNENSTCFRHPI